MTGIVDTRWAAASARARLQHGALSLDELFDCGFERHHVETAVRTQRLFRVHEGVFALGYVPKLREFRWMAAVLACGAGAALSHRCAATLWRIRDGVGPRVDVTASGRHHREGIHARSAVLLPHELTTRNGIPVTTVARTIVDLVPEIDDDEIPRVLGEAQYRRVFDLNAIEEVLHRRPNRRLQPFIDDLVHLQTGIEDRFYDLCLAHGLPRPLTQKKLQGQKVDFFWPEHRLVVETDGWWAHSTFTAFQADRARTNALLLEDYLVLRFTFADITRRPVRTARQIARALARSTA